MSQKKTKQFRKQFSKMYKKSLYQKADEMLENKYNEQMDNMGKQVFKYASQRDWFIILSIIEFLGIIILIYFIVR